MKRFFCSFFNVIALLLIIAGGINWGLWGFFQFDLVAWIFHGNTNWSARIIYAIIGLAGVWSLGFLGRLGALCCRPCRSCNHDHQAPHDEDKNV